MNNKESIKETKRYFHKSKKIGIIATIAIATFTLAACQKQAETPVNNNNTQTTTTTKENKTETNTEKLKLPPAPDGWVVTEKKVWVPVLNDIGENLKNARESYLKKDNNKAIAQIEQAIVLLKKEEDTATEKQTATLEKAIADLEKLTTEIKTGKVSSVAEIDRVFVEALKADIESKWVLVVEDRAYSIFTEVAKHWQNAKKFFPTNKDVAASEIRKGTVFLEFEASRATEKQQQETILATVKELNNLADRVQKGEVKDSANLDRAFAKANLTLAEFYTDKANIAEANNEMQKIGYELQAALKHVEAAGDWSKKDLDLLTDTEKKQITKIADKLVEGEKEDTTAIKNAIESLEKQIDRLGREIA
ncbi:MAG: hypothetical protein ACFBSE_05110 [Prochloraceae cyanobacterium]